MKLKVPYWEEKFDVELYNMDGEAQYRQPKDGQWEAHRNKGTPMSLMPKATHLTGLIQCTGLWFAGGKFGCTWKLLQAKLQQPVRLVGSGVCHIVEDSDDEDTLAELKAKAEEKEAFIQQDDAYTQEDTPTFGGESDEEESEHDEEEETDETPAPKKKVVKKKRVVKKKKTNGD